MPVTVCLPKALHRAQFRAPSVDVGGRIGEGEPIASFSRKGKVEVMPSTATGVVLRVLVSEPIQCDAGDPIALVGEAGEDVGYDPDQIRCVRLELLNKCSECGNDYPVNGLFEEVRCNRCGDQQALPPGFWQEQLVEDVDFARVPGARGGGKVLGGPTIECRGIPPFCNACSTLIPMDALTAAWKEAGAGGSARVECKGCGAHHAARFAPDWARDVFDGLVFLFGEVGGRTEEGAPKPVVFKCPNCSAALQIAGRDRIVQCQYCESEVFLPDELWLHLNPAAKKSKWWMLLEPR